MPPRVTVALVAESKSMDPDLHWLRLSAPDVGASLRAGQLLALSQRDRLDPYLPTPVFPTHIASGEMGCLLRPGERERWLASLREGDSVQVIAPLGKGFAVDPPTRNLLIVAEGVDGLPLLPLAQESAARHMEVSVIAWSAYSRAGLLPPGLLTSSTEYNPAVGAEALAQALAATLGWANQVCAAGSPQLYLALREGIQQARLRYARGLCQVLVRKPMMCCMGICGQCQTRLRSGVVHVCADGPVFDLKDVV